MYNTTVMMLKNEPFIGDKVEKDLESYGLFQKVDTNKNGFLEQKEVNSYFDKIGRNHTKKDV